jgi:DNA uptake protein ComE-like DNA-binding protein
MYEPQHGMPVQVPDERLNDFLALGYRTTPPYTPPPPTPSQTPNKPTGEQTPPENKEGENLGLIKINSASLKELAERCGLSTAQAKELRDRRPYATVEDLIAKIPDIDWVSLSPQMSFD